jgi:hypothetical protein
MKTTINLPASLFRDPTFLAAKRGTTLHELVVEGLKHVTAAAPAVSTPALTVERSSVATLGAHGLPVLKRSAHTTRPKITRALIDRIRK